MEETIARVVGYIEEEGLSVTEYTEVEPDPSIEIINQGAEIVREKGIEVMIGLGGGSAIDAAKAIAVMHRVMRWKPSSRQRPHLSLPAWRQRP